MVDVESLHSVAVEAAVEASASDWQTPADWPIFDDPKQDIWNIRIGVPERVSSGIPLRPYWPNSRGGSLTDTEIRDHLPAPVAERVLALAALTAPPPRKKRVKQ